jgi:hypothetical protein
MKPARLLWEWILKARFLPLLILCVACSAGDGSGGTSGAGGEDTNQPSDLLEDSDTEENADAAAPDAQAGDVTQANDSAPLDSSEELPPPNGVAKFSNCSEPGGDRNVYDLQDPQCPDHIDPAPTDKPGIAVTLSGVIVTAAFGDTIFVQEPPGGPYSGVAVFIHGLPKADFTVGDELSLSGNYFEYFGNTQIFLTEWEKTGTQPEPQPFFVSHAAHIATDGAMAEMMEGVLVKVTQVSTIHTKPDCPQEWGEFMVSGELRVDDMGFAWDARLGDEFASIVGPLSFGFGNTKIEPRTAADLDVIKEGATGSTSKCIESDCIVPATQTGTQQVVVNEIMADPFGDDDGQEWIELFNPGNDDLSIDGWVLKDCGGQSVPLAGAKLIVPAHGYLVIGNNANPVTNGGVPVDHAYGDLFYLPNSLGSVILFDGNTAVAKVVDQARFSAFSSDVPLLTGRSLERTKPDSDGTLQESWRHGTSIFGNGENQGTPGAKNDGSQ